MYIIIGSHFVLLEGKFLLIALFFYKCDSASNATKQRCIHCLKTCSQTLKHFDNIFHLRHSIFDLSESYKERFNRVHHSINGSNLSSFLYILAIQMSNVKPTWRKICVNTKSLNLDITYSHRHLILIFGFISLAEFNLLFGCTCI